MALTTKEEALLKREQAVRLAHFAWNKEAKEMQQEIQAEFNSIDQRIRQNHKASMDAKQAAKVAAEQALNAEMDTP